MIFFACRARSEAMHDRSVQRKDRLAGLLRQLKEITANSPTAKAK